MPPTNSSPRSPSTDLPKESPRTILFQFVLFPLGVVAIGVGIFLLFGMLSSEDRSVREHLNSIQSGSSQRRWQAAYQLSKSLERGEAAAYPDLHLEVQRLLTESRDPMLRRYLTLVLGKLGRSESIPVIVETLDDPDVDTRVYALLALAEIGDASSLPAIIELARDEERDVRKAAVFAMGALGDSRAVEPLAGALDDPVADVRWNAALGLSRFDDPRALPLLTEMLDRSRLDGIEGMREDQKEQTMLAAIEAYRRLAGAEASPLLTEIAGSDPNLRVQSAARAALDPVTE